MKENKVDKSNVMLGLISDFEWGEKESQRN